MSKRILVACEESQAVTIAFRKAGHEAFSADVLDCSGGHPEWHIKGDVTPLLHQPWDMVIAFPPCTHLSAAGAYNWDKKLYDGRLGSAIAFFMACYTANAPRICVENPVGYMSRLGLRPTQYVQPYCFGDPFMKKTGLWLRNLPELNPTNIVEVTDRYRDGRGKLRSKWFDGIPGSDKDRAKKRAKTFPGIAMAMAEQWGALE